MNIRILTDSASDIVETGRKDLSIVPLRVIFDGREYRDGVDLSHREFYEKLVENDCLPTTSQVPPGDFEEVLERSAADGEAVIVITLSSKLSGTYQSACIAADGYENVYVVDSESATIGEHALVEYALRLKDSGKCAENIVGILEQEKKKLRVVGLLDTLEYLKRGGRISKTVALAGAMLSMKPVITIENGEILLLGKARGSRQGNNLLMQSVDKSGGIDFTRPFFLGYTGLSDALLQKYIADSASLWQGRIETLPIGTIGGTIGTHAGPGAVAVAFFAEKG